MPDKRCENGHFIDENWDLCPYCPQAQQDRVPVPRGIAPTRAGVDLVPQVPSQSRSGDPIPKAPGAPPSGPSRTVALSRLPAEVRAITNRYVVGWLVGLNGSLRGQSFEIRTGKNVIGRDRKSDVLIQDDQVSGHHADLVYRPDERRYILMDHNSTNGSYVDEKEIEARRVLNGSEILRFGTHQLLFVALCTDDMYWEGEGVLK